jgi:hypothetical protein
LNTSLEAVWCTAHYSLHGMDFFTGFFSLGELLSIVNSSITSSPLPDFDLERHVSHPLFHV